MQKKYERIRNAIYIVCKTKEQFIFRVLPPRLSSTFDRTKGVEPITYSESFMKDDPNFKSESKTLNSVELNAWEKWLVKKLEAEQKSLRKKVKV